MQREAEVMADDTIIYLQAGATLNLYRGLTKGYLDAAFPEALKPITEGISNMATVIEDLVREVAETRTVTDSAVALLQGLKAALDAAVAANDMTAVAAAVADLDAQQAALAAAITANTPSA
jgi:hypothetical protein